MASIQKRGKSSWLFTVETGSGTKRGRETMTYRVEDTALLKTTKKLKDHLESEWNKFKIEVESGNYFRPEKMTFREFTGLWSDKFVDKNLAETSAFNYKYHSTTKLTPILGDIQMDKIKTLDIVTLLDELSKKTGEASVVYCFRVLRSIFSKAVSWKVIKVNPMDGIDKPKETPKEMSFYNEQEVAELLKSLQKETIKFKIFVTLALTTGMRRGELLGLEWRHINLEKGSILVHQTIPMFKDGMPVIKGPKRGTGRTITLPSSVVKELVDYQKHMMRVRTELKVPWEGGEYSFLFAHDNGRPKFPKNWGDYWREFHARNPQLRYIRFHDLRHTSATLLISSGVHAKIISSRLGHTKISTTMNIYGHIIEAADQSAADVFNTFLQPPKIVKRARKTKA
ncbi:site-specific integrase [Paenibacillus sp. FSL L8-0708]|uniref:site-specific integrase n=1 Tax=Paenibacillus sp. FSL L8-0708 TaxID=2975311 RepID=UPI0030FC79B9